MAKLTIINKKINASAFLSQPAVFNQTGCDTLEVLFDVLGGTTAERVNVEVETLLGVELFGMTHNSDNVRVMNPGYSEENKTFAFTLNKRDFEKGSAKLSITFVKPTNTNTHTFDCKDNCAGGTLTDYLVKIIVNKGKEDEFTVQGNMTYCAKPVYTGGGGGPVDDAPNYSVNIGDGRISYWTNW